MDWPLGKTVRSTFTLTDPDTGQPVDAGSVTSVGTWSDNGATVTGAVVHPGTGSWFADYQGDHAATLKVLWTAIGPDTVREDFITFEARFSDPLWTPTLDQVAQHVPLDTMERGNLTGTLANTFTALTLPTSDQVTGLIDDACGYLLAAVGIQTVIPATMFDLAGAAVSLRAAAYVELAQPPPRRDHDLVRILLERSDAELAKLVVALSDSGAASPAGAVNPYWHFPTPIRWGDTLL